MKEIGRCVAVLGFEMAFFEDRQENLKTGNGFFVVHNLANFRFVRS
jgi:hypothetical protein